MKVGDNVIIIDGKLKLSGQVEMVGESVGLHKCIYLKLKGDAKLYPASWASPYRADAAMRLSSLNMSDLINRFAKSSASIKLASTDSNSGLPLDEIATALAQTEGSLLYYQDILDELTLIEGQELERLFINDSHKYLAA